MERRTFLGTMATALAAANAPAGKASAATTKVGVITHSGGAHLDIYFRCLAAMEEVGSVVLADIDGSAADAARTALGSKLTAVYQSPMEMVDKEHPTLALVSMEAILAPPAIEVALRAGCHVLAEKPACSNGADFEALAKIADANNLHLMLALANRMNPEVIEARRIIAEGRLGKIYAVEMHLVQDQTRLTNPAYHASWFADRARAGGGHLAWLGIHWLDLAMHVTGARTEAVSGFAANVGGQPINIEDAVAMSMRFDNGALGTLTSGYYLDKGSQSHMKIWGEKGWLLMDSAQPRSLTGQAGGKPISFQGEPRFDPYVPCLRAAVQAAAGASPPWISTAESLHALRCVYGLYDAASTAKTVLLR